MNKQEPTVDLVKKLGLIDSRVKEIEAEKQILLTEYNNIILELWERIPPLKEENEFQPKHK